LPACVKLCSNGIDAGFIEGQLSAEHSACEQALILDYHPNDPEVLDQLIQWLKRQGLME
jgi:hypothetical protein